MPNPYAARRKRRPSHPQRQSPLDEFCRRIRLLGATEPEVAAVRATWDDLDADWTLAQRTALTLLSDDDLRAELLATRQEYAHDTTDERQQEAQDAASHVARVGREAQDIIGRPVATVLGWVGGDVIRALAVLTLEEGEQGARRSTLIGPLTALVSPPDSQGIAVEVLA